MPLARAFEIVFLRVAQIFATNLKVIRLPPRRRHIHVPQRARDDHSAFSFDAATRHKRGACCRIQQLALCPCAEIVLKRAYQARVAGIVAQKGRSRKHDIRSQIVEAALVLVAFVQPRRRLRKRCADILDFTHGAALQQPAQALKRRQIQRFIRFHEH